MKKEEVSKYSFCRLMKADQIFLSTLDYKDQIVTLQFLEYATTHLNNLPNNSSVDTSIILHDINEFLAEKVYLMGNKQGTVDRVFYEMLYSTMSKLTMKDKELYLHLSRWFAQIQENETFRQSRPRVLFSRTALYH